MKGLNLSEPKKSKMEHTMPNVFITGSNRGLGMEWVRQYAEEGWRVFAACRRPTEAVELNNYGRRGA
jgi:NAD(P)-dependent dehydrogenase (short-subunit alcohol dehydrogenase family)